MAKFLFPEYRSTETINLRWKDGLFLPVASMSGLERLAAEKRADDLFLVLLDRCNDQGRNTCDKPSAQTIVVH